jgi:hypothetical protein
MRAIHLNVALLLALSNDMVLARRVSADDVTPWPTLGMVGRYKTPVLPGDRLVIKPIFDSAPLRVWILEATKSGGGYSYVLAYSGLRPDSYDLARYLIRRDGSIPESIPAMIVHVDQTLPGSTPGLLSRVAPARAPGYLPDPLLSAKRFASAWGFFGIVLLLVAWVYGGKRRRLWRWRFGGRWNPDPRLVELADMATLNDEGRLSDTGKARLGWVMDALWRDYYRMESAGPAEILRKLREHPEVGPRFRFLERWLHDSTAATDREVAEFILQEVERLAAADRSRGTVRDAS